MKCVTSKKVAAEDRSEVSCPAYGFRCGIRKRSGAEGYSSGQKELQ